MNKIGFFGLCAGIAVIGSALPMDRAAAAPGEGVAVFEFDAKKSARTSASDLKGIRNAKGRLQILDKTQYLGSSRSSQGLRQTPPVVMIPKGERDRSSGRLPTNYGSYKYPHTTSAVAGLSKPKKGGILHSNTSARPYLTTGKLWMQFSSGWGSCTGSMIGKGIVVTAAHCLYTYGKSGTQPKTVYFAPGATANSLSSGPIGYWTAAKIYMPSCYKLGSCIGDWTSNDIALIKLAGRTSSLPSKKGSGIYGYATGTWGWSKGGTYLNKDLWLAQITQLGYPGNLGYSSNNAGSTMIRTDSVARYYKNGNSKNLVWGSGQTQGCSGGPILQNFGRRPHVTSRGWKGYRPNANILTGVTSFGANMPTGHLLGATFWTTSANYSKLYKDTAGKKWGYGPIGYLMRQVCGKGYGNLNSAYCGY